MLQTRPAFSSDFCFHAPPSLLAAFREGAARDLTTAPDFVRRAVVQLLRESWVAIPSDQAPAGADRPSNPAG